MKYLVDVSQSVIYPVTVEADSQHEAKECALSGGGDSGEGIQGDAIVITVRLLDDGYEA